MRFLMHRGNKVLNILYKIFPLQYHKLPIYWQGQTIVVHKNATLRKFCQKKLDIAIQNWQFYGILTVDKCLKCISVSYKNIWIVHPIKDSNRFCLAMRFQPKQQQTRFRIFDYSLLSSFQGQSGVNFMRDCKILVRSASLGFDSCIPG